MPLGNHSGFALGLSLYLNSSALPSSEGYISQYTPQGVYGIILDQIIEVIITLMIVRMIFCPYQDSTYDIRSNIPLRLQEFPRALASGTSLGVGVFLTIYPSSRPNTIQYILNKYYKHNKHYKHSEIEIYLPNLLENIFRYCPAVKALRKINSSSMYIPGRSMLDL